MTLEQLQKFVETVLEELPGIAEGREDMLRAYPDRKDTATFSDGLRSVADRIRRGYEALQRGEYE